MIRNAIGSLKCAVRVFGPCLALSLTAASSAAWAQEDVRDTTVTARDVVMSPLADLNLASDPIPPILLEAQLQPYADGGLASCTDILHQIGNLDAVLGEDFDTQSEQQRKLSIGSVAKSAVGMLIPFRGIIREVSGANDREKAFRDAIAAGLVRRAYLKGLGEAKDCPYPARPARMEDLSPQTDESAVAVPFVSEPVVQKTD